MVIFFNRDGKWVERPLPSNDETLPRLPDEAYEEGRNAAPGYDIYALENDWRDFWESSGKPKIDNPAAAAPATSARPFSGRRQAMTTRTVLAGRRPSPVPPAGPTASRRFQARR